MDIIPDFGKYTFYVWTCYGVSIFALAALATHTFVQKKQRQNDE
ncbi:MAG: heme exporter protein CcmD [Robiginitomaculum sp.]|nr:MAG: heme exporter protein CcmD [Robiginitomaculum sp.]